MGAQWLSGRVLDSRWRGRGFESHQRHWLSLRKNISPSLVLVQPLKNHPFITERLLLGRKESNQTNKICVYNSTLLLEESNFYQNLMILDLPVKFFVHIHVKLFSPLEQDPPFWQVIFIQ